MISKTVTLPSSKNFDVKVTGDEQSVTVLILVHGFGVKSDSRGLFTLIEDSFKNKFLVVRPDFAVMGVDQIGAVPLSLQADRLQQVVDFISNEFGEKKIVYIGHSQGCIAVAKAMPKESKIILLAPPIDSPYENFARSKGWKCRGSSLNLYGESKLIRTDGTKIIVNKGYWDDFRQLNVASLYTDLSKNNDVLMILAAEDHVLGKQTIPEGMNGFSIDEANHDFKDSARILLVKKLLELI